MKKIIVAQVVGKWIGGGVESVIMNYYRHIDRDKVQFDFICDSDSTNIPYEEIESLGGRVLLVPPYQKLPKYIKELKRIFKENNYKIVHSHINTLSVFPLYAAKKVGVPIRIAHSHSTIVNNKREFKRNLIKKTLKPFSKTFSNRYFACSDLAAISQFGKKSFENNEIIYINNAIDLEKFKYNEKIRKSKRKELKHKDNTLVIGHIGRFVETKNHTFLIDVFNEIHKKEKNSVLLLAGQGPLEEEIKNKVTSLNLDDSVMFLGQREDINELYQVFDIFLLPSLYEGLPVVGVEAQASGLLCIFSDNMTKKAKILDSTVLLPLSKDSNAWANLALNNYKDFIRKDTFDEMTKKGFNIQKEANKLEKEYIEYCK